MFIVTVAAHMDFLRVDFRVMMILEGQLSSEVHKTPLFFSLVICQLSDFRKVLGLYNVTEIRVSMKVDHTM